MNFENDDVYLKIPKTYEKNHNNSNITKYEYIVEYLEKTIKIPKSKLEFQKKIINTIIIV